MPWYKNLRIYRFTEQDEQPDIDAFDKETLEEALVKHQFAPCGAHDEFSFGFVSSYGDPDSMAVEVGSYLGICAKKEERILPAAAVNEELSKRVAAIEHKEARKLPNKERARLKDELIFELLPNALTKSEKIHAYIDVDGGYLVVDSASSNKAEELLSRLRKALGSLPVVPLTTELKPINAMTAWLEDDHNLPAKFTIDDECELKSPEEDGATIKCKHHDLALPEIKTHIDNGKQVTKLALTYDDRISFTLDKDLAIKRVKFLDLVQEKAADIEAFDEVDMFTADFTIMTGELSKLIADVVLAFSSNE